MTTSLRIDHVCVAVKSIEKASQRLCALLGYRPRTLTVTNTRQKVHVAFLCREGSLDIKLIEPAGDDSPLWFLLRAKRKGLHHLCFRTTDLAVDLPGLASRGLRLLGTPAPGEAFDDHPIAFGYAGFGLNLEFVDTDLRRGEIERPDAQDG